MARALPALILALLALLPVVPLGFGMAASSVEPEVVFYDWNITLTGVPHGNHTVRDSADNIIGNLPVLSESLGDDNITITVCDEPTSNYSIIAITVYWDPNTLTYHAPPVLPTGWVIDYANSNADEGYWTFQATNSTYYIDPGECLDFTLTLDSNVTASTVTNVTVRAYFETGAYRDLGAKVFIDADAPKMSVYLPPASTEYFELPGYDAVAFVKALYDAVNNYYYTSYTIQVGDYDTYRVDYDSPADTVALTSYTLVKPADANGTVSLAFNSWLNQYYNATVSVSTNVTNNTVVQPVDGWYNYTLTHNDYAGHSTSKTVAVFVDNTPPTLLEWSLSVANGTYQQLAPGTPITIQVNITDNSLFYKYFKPGLDFNKTIVENYLIYDIYTSPGNATWPSISASLVGDKVVVTITFPGTSTGFHNITLGFRDAAGNENATMLHLAFVVDREAPSILTVYIENEAENFTYTFYVGDKVYFNGTHLNITILVPEILNLTLKAYDDTKWHLNDTIPGVTNGGIIYVGQKVIELGTEVFYPIPYKPMTITLPGIGTVTVYINETIFNGTGYVYIFNPTDRNLTSILGIVRENTTRIIAITALDPSGRQSAWYNFTIVYDTAAPNVTVTSPVHTMIYNTSTVTVLFNTSDLGPAGLWKVKACIFNSTNARVWLNESGDINATLAYYLVNTTVTLPDDWYTLVVKSYDLAGNLNKITLVFGVDTTPPTVTIESPVDGRWYNTSSIEVTVTAVDNIAGVDKIVAAVNGTEVAGTLNGTSGDLVRQFTATVTLGEGWYNLTAYANDTVANTASEVVAWFGVDLTAPEVYVVSPANNSVLSSTEVSFEVYACDALSGIDAAATKVWLDNSLVAVTVDYNVSSCTLSFNLTIPDGTHNVTVKVYDYAGNSNTTLVTFLVDTQPPQVYMDIQPPTVVVGDTNYTNANATIVFTVVDLGRGVDSASIEVTLDGTTSVPYTVSCPTVYTCYVTVSFTGLAEGLHTINVTAADLGGWYNTTAVFTFGVDATPPSLEVTVTAQKYSGAVVEIIVSDNIVGVDNVTLVIGGVSIGVDASVLTSSTPYFCNATACYPVSLDTYPPQQLIDMVARGYGLRNNTASPFALVYSGRAAVFVNATQANVTIAAYDLVYNENKTVVAMGAGEEGVWFPVVVYPEWSLFSVPLLTEWTMPSPDSGQLENHMLGPSSCLSSANYAFYYYNTTTGAWQRWALVGGLVAIYELHELRDGLAYWVYSECSTPVLFVVEGRLVPPPGQLPPEYKLVPGWNLLGYITLGTTKNLYEMNLTGSPAYIDSAYVDVRNIGRYLVAWDPIAQQYAVYYISDVSSGAGYWLPPYDTVFGYNKVYPGMGLWVYAYQEVTLIPPWVTAVPE